MSERRSGIAAENAPPRADEAIARLRTLSDRARRLPPPSSRRPELFHEARDELARDLRDVAAEIERAFALRRPCNAKGRAPRLPNTPE